jgi:hypothetical protein
MNSQSVAFGVNFGDVRLYLFDKERLTLAIYVCGRADVIAPQRWW